ncbi:MAG: class II fructose-bisphosphatase [Halanaerobacter sp.]
MNLELGKNFNRVTEKAALSVAPLIGNEDKMAVDQTAVDAMREAFETISIGAKVVVGEGEKDQAPGFFINEQVGRKNKHEIDLAIDPIEGTTFAAKNKPNSVAVLAGVEAGKMLKVPDMYMDKIVVGPKAKGKVSLNKGVLENLAIVAGAEGKSIDELTVAILDRERHEDLIEQIEDAGAEVKLIEGADLIWGIAAVRGMAGVDILMGSGGAPEGILTAAAVKCLGGYMEAKLCPRHDKDRKKAENLGIDDCGQIFTLNDMIQGDEIIFSLTGVTDGILVDGITDGITQSIVMRRNSEGQSYIREMETDYLVTESLKIS